MSHIHSFAPMALPRAHCLTEATAADYDRRLIGFHLRFADDIDATGAGPGSVMGMGSLFYLSFQGTTVPIAVASTARQADARHWEVMLGRASGVAPGGTMRPNMFRVGHEGVDVPARLGFAVWLSLPFSTPLPRIDTELLWTY